MNKEEITEKFIEAKELVSEIEEPYRHLALEVVFRWLLDQAPSLAPPISSVAAPTISPSMTLNEFLASKNPTSHKDRVLLVAYYYLYSKNEPVTRSEIDEAYSLARMRRPKNISDIISKCVGKGYFVDYRDGKEGNKAWQITQTGEKYVQEKLSGA